MVSRYLAEHVDAQHYVEPEVSDNLFDPQKIIEALLAVAFGGWAWVVRSFGKEHLKSQDDIIRRQDRLESKIDSNSERISRLEGRMESDE